MPFTKWQNIFFFYFLSYADMEEVHTVHETFNMKINPA